MQRALVSKQDINILPKLSLGVRGARCLRGAEGVRMRHSQWKIANYKVHAVAVRFQNVFHNRIHRATGRTLKVSELDDRHRRVCVSARRAVASPDVYDGPHRLW